jgi:hypothetical protein
MLHYVDRNVNRTNLVDGALTTTIHWFFLLGFIIKNTQK